VLQPEAMQDLDPPGEAVPPPPPAVDAPPRDFLALRSSSRRGKLLATTVFALLAGGMLFFPSFADSRYHLTLATLTLMWMGLASSWNLISGFTSYASFGHAALFGLGAYIVGIGTVRYELNV
jgi:ABC-type branched-subunit amino acid transport system permease subunit